MTGLRIDVQSYPVANQAGKKKPSNIRVIVVESTIFHYLIRRFQVSQPLMQMG